MEKVAYGPGKYQWGELYRAEGERLPGVAVVIHGGYWRSKYTAELGSPLAEDLARHGLDAWNIEYRRAGNGGGWPETFQDVSSAIDQLARLDVDTSRVVALGHSAGGQLAVWAATRGAMPAGAPGANPAVAVTGVVSQAGVLDLQLAKELKCGDGAVVNFLGKAVDERYRLADPAQNVPVPVPVWLVYGSDDHVVPTQIQDSYLQRAEAAGGQVERVVLGGGHFELIDVKTSQWARCRELALAAVSDPR